MGKLGLKLVFWKSISSHTHAFLFLIFNALRYVFKNLVFFFFKRGVFPDFRLIHCVFRSIEILVKNFSEPLSGSIDWTCFSINQTSWIRFFKKTQIWLVHLLFQNFFKLSSFSLSPTWQSSTEDFLLFSTKFFLKVFSLPRPVRPLYPLFCFYFHDFMHKLMHFNGIFETFHIWDFCWINPLFLKLIIGFWILILWKLFHLILMHFFIIFQCFEERLHQILLFFKNSFFLQFRSIESVFRSIEIAFKNFNEPLPGSIDRTCFSINRTSWIRFF